MSSSGACGSAMAPLLLLALPAGCCACVAAKKINDDRSYAPAPPPYYYPPSPPTDQFPPQLRMAAAIVPAKFTTFADISSINIVNELQIKVNAKNGVTESERALSVRSSDVTVMQVVSCDISRSSCLTELGSFDLKISLPEENLACLRWPGQPPTFSLHPTLTCQRTTSSRCGLPTVSEVTVKHENQTLGYIQDPSSVVDYGFAIYNGDRKKILMVKRRAFFKPDFDITLPGAKQIVSTIDGTVTDIGINMEVKFNELQASNRILVAVAAMYIQQFYLQQIFLGAK